jgi:hypothetical protein
MANILKRRCIFTSLEFLATQRVLSVGGVGVGLAPTSCACPVQILAKDRQCVKKGVYEKVVGGDNSLVHWYVMAYRRDWSCLWTSGQ